MVIERIPFHSGRIQGWVSSPRHPSVSFHAAENRKDSSTMISSAYLLLSQSAPVWPSKDVLRAFRGNLVAKLSFSLPYAPHGLLFTPGYVTYDEPTRRRIREEYKQNGWTHFPLNLTNHSTIYRNYYPQWSDDRINDYLIELLTDGLIPVGYVMGDHDTVVNCKADPELVPIVVPKWEDEKPLKRPALDADNTFHLVRQKYPKSLLYWHNPPYQGAPFVEYADWGLPQGDPGINAKVWRYMVHECGVQGLLFQGKAWEHDANDSISVLNSFRERLKHGVSGWPIADLVDYEETAFYLFNMNGSNEQALAWTQKIRSSVGELNGFGNG